MCYFKLYLTICQKAEGERKCGRYSDTATTTCLSSIGGNKWGQSPSAVLAGVAGAALLGVVRQDPLFKLPSQRQSGTFSFCNLLLTLSIDLPPGTP